MTIGEFGILPGHTPLLTTLKVGELTRITSYNVCYTKLLRSGGGEHHVDGGALLKDFVITSYSIHYTKLYESGA